MVCQFRIHCSSGAVSICSSEIAGSEKVEPASVPVTAPGHMVAVRLKRAIEPTAGATV